MAKGSEPPGHPFAKILELRFTQVKATPERKQKSDAATRGSRASGKPVAAKVEPETTPPGGKRTRRASKKKKQRRGNSAPAFVTSLPNPRLLTAAGTKKVQPSRPFRQNAPAGIQDPAQEAKVKQREAKAKSPRPRHNPDKSVESLILGLPKRSMLELQKQWLNCLRLLEQPKTPKIALRRFKQAIVLEWEQRSGDAFADPNHFEWPTTSAGPGDRSQHFNNWHAEGILKYLGYEVGETRGASDFARREILDTVFEAALPPINEPTYIRAWGLPGSAARLERLANEIARFARNGKRNRSADYSTAVADWEADLRYLYKKYYSDKFKFGWPRLA